MISKWYIGVNAKSRGYFKGWKNGYINFKSSYRDRIITVDPSFTKQTALATGHKTEQEAYKALDVYRKDCIKLIQEGEAQKLSYELGIKTWDTLTLEEKYEYAKDNQLNVTYVSSGGYETNINFRYYEFADMDEVMLTAIENYKFEGCIKIVETKLGFIKLRLDYINEKLQVRECDCEIKFKDSERERIEWVVRGEHDTAYGFCNCCGGAIPEIPQLNIGWKIKICAICMKRLADEADIQAGKIDPEIMEHYQTDRFLRSLS